VDQGTATVHASGSRQEPADAVWFTAGEHRGRGVDQFGIDVITVPNRRSGDE